MGEKQCVKKNEFDPLVRHVKRPEQEPPNPRFPNRSGTKGIRDALAKDGKQKGVLN